MRALQGTLGFVVLCLSLASGCSGGDGEGSETGASGAAGSSAGTGVDEPAAGGMSSSGGAENGSDNAGAASDIGGSGPANAGASTAGGTTAGSGGSSLGYLPCESKQDCEAFGGGTVCCAAGAMHFCTKPSACPGDTLP